MPLSKIQQKHLDSVRWLVNGPRQEGKTFLLMYVFIEKAEQNLGVWFDFHDIHYHIKNPQLNGYLCNILRAAFTQKFKGVKRSFELQISRRQMKFRIVKDDESYDLSQDPYT